MQSESQQFQERNKRKEKKKKKRHTFDLRGKVRVFRTALLKHLTEYTIGIKF